MAVFVVGGCGQVLQRALGEAAEHVIVRALIAWVDHVGSGREDHRLDVAATRAADLLSDPAGRLPWRLLSLLCGRGHDALDAAADIWLEQISASPMLLEVMQTMDVGEASLADAVTAAEAVLAAASTVADVPVQDIRATVPA